MALLLPLYVWLLRSILSLGYQDRRIPPLPFFHGCHTKGLIAITPEIDCNKTAMGLPPVTSAVFLIANFGKTWVSWRNI
jgi:hypothetical protein